MNKMKDSKDKGKKHGLGEGGQDEQRGEAETVQEDEKD